MAGRRRAAGAGGAAAGPPARHRATGPEDAAQPGRGTAQADADPQRLWPVRRTAGRRAEHPPDQATVRRGLPRPRLQRGLLHAGRALRRPARRRDRAAEYRRSAVPALDPFRSQQRRHGDDSPPPGGRMPGAGGSVELQVRGAWRAGVSPALRAAARDRPRRRRRDARAGGRLQLRPRKQRRPWQELRDPVRRARSPPGAALRHRLHCGIRLGRGDGDVDRGCRRARGGHAHGLGRYELRLRPAGRAVPRDRQGDGGPGPRLRRGRRGIGPRRGLACAGDRRGGGGRAAAQRACPRPD